MKVVEVSLSKHFTTTLFDPNPNRLDADEMPVSERQLDLEYFCEQCGNPLSFETSSFEKHCKSNFTNLNSADSTVFNGYIKANNLDKFSFLDFYCPNCKQPAKFLFECGNSGYWGSFFFEIKNALVLK